ncbi:NAD-dependent epimerase/dehydratase family protein [Paenibacillus nanensis]|uniref:NAD-dependent epimerase/dehydratase family protein n=1 Tax=Paenibacillus nanensis TaxID=393251 RepID=A0A3A1V3N4_9BACL|nr:NAD-dependent epimerase/dehydratase family protein [Paenibacillus nanensis]RIX53992.1 NAD-dependent epimerase/dehydratase family protein [Paenibacillus nanensis]
MRIVVTGAAGFVGSHLCERLLDDGHEVIGIDALIRDELQRIGVRNAEAAIAHPRFKLRTENLLSINWDDTLEDIDIVYHLAGIPGVRNSWGEDFGQYVINNIGATQRLLEACKGKKLKKFIFVSTSSVYGEKAGMVSEDAIPLPLSPYGVSKLTGEHLCRVYWHNEGVPVVILRYFTVYGPRQRSDMAFHRFIRQMLTNRPVTLYGDGTQSRDFTFVTDCAAATAAVAAAENVIGETINIGGKERASIMEVIQLLEKLTGRRVNIEHSGGLKGEPMHTWADISKAERLLGYKPKVGLEEGLRREIEYLTSRYLETE